MKGAIEKYKLIKAAVPCVDGLIDVSQKFVHLYGGYASTTYQYKMYLFLLNDHARGKTIRIWLLDVDYCLNDYTNLLVKPEYLEIYGIVSGQPGWTEVYDWKEPGPWQDEVKAILEHFETMVAKYTVEEFQRNVIKQHEESIKHSTKIDKFKAMFEEDK